MKTERQNTYTGVYSDSRAVVENSLFVAVKGTQSDGHDYIAEAIKRGASHIICERMPAETPSNVHFQVVPDSAQALGETLDEFYGSPSRKMKLVGVTGTNGKTTIATLLYNLFRALGHKAGLLSTVCNYIDGEALPTSHTTPDAVVLHKLIAQMHTAGCEYVFMEVSSHAVDQKRISGLTFAGGVFSNLTRDHLDYHLTMSNYLNAKKAFFDNLPKDAFALSNIDDKAGLVMLQNTRAKQKTYAVRSDADHKGKILESHFDGTELMVDGIPVYVPFVGTFNVYNLLAVYGSALALGAEGTEVLRILSALRPVAGRFQTTKSPKGYTAIVDYAHTPDALTNVLKTVHEVLNGKGRILTVVGCGGNRDKGKRPLMAKEAVRMSDQVILTSDNPRFEEPEDILADMIAGLSPEEQTQTLCISDRHQAIKTATLLAKPGDVILIAGKGHEDYQDIRGVKHPFDDYKIIQELF